MLSYVITCSFIYFLFVTGLGGTCSYFCGQHLVYFLLLSLSLSLHILNVWYECDNAYGANLFWWQGFQVRVSTSSLQINVLESRLNDTCLDSSDRCRTLPRRKKEKKKRNWRGTLLTDTFRENFSLVLAQANWRLFIGHNSKYHRN